MAEQKISDVVERANALLVGVRGASGAGKSTLTRQYGEKINNSGGVCIWAPAEEIIQNVSPATMILKILRHFRTSLNDHAGDDALDIASKVPGGIILLIDDVNRLDAPHDALEAARVCVKVEARGQTSEEQAPRIRFVIPLWPEQLSGQSAAEKAGWEIVDIGFYTDKERRELAGAYEGHRSAELLTLIDSLNGDPFLCGLALSGQAGLDIGYKADRGILIKHIVDSVLSSAAHEASRLRRVNATAEEFAVALDQLIELMLRTEHPETTLREVRNAFGAHTAELLLILGETNQLGWIEQRLEDSRWRWKHDRLRDALLGRWLAMRIVPHLSQGEQTEEHAKLLRLPGLAEAWAWSLTFAPRDYQVALAGTLADHQPLALAGSLLLVQLPDGSSLRRTVVKGLRHALEDFNPGRESFVTPPQWPILRRLTSIDNPVVLEVTEHMEQNWHTSLARFRNGDTQAGLRLLKRRGTLMGFHPSVRFPTLERAVEAYACFKASSCAEVVNELAHAASDM